MKQLTTDQRFWVAVIVVGGFLVFGGLVAFLPIHDGATIFVNTVLSTMGPLVGWVVKGLFEGAGATGKPGDSVNMKEVNP